MIPAWFFFALASSLCSALGMYMHQRLGGSNVASAIWMKLLAVGIAVPVLIRTGLPQDPVFYLLTAGAAIIWCFNDLIYFQAVKNHGAALLARLSPLGLILGFVAWFLIHPELLNRYMADMPRFIGICATLLLAMGCAMWLRQCAVSWRALKDIWYIIAASVIGILFVKSAVDYAPKDQGVFGYVGFEATLMLIFYAFYFGISRRATLGDVFSKTGLKTGGIVGLCLMTGVVLRTQAQQSVDHPAFVTMISMLDVIWLIILTRLSGWKDDSNKIAGLGIVLAALALAFLKIR